MTLLCALDDFVERTLAFVAGSWGKLHYVSGLRGERGEYCHWGLAEKFSAAAAQQAIEQAHRNVLFELLRAPLRDLLLDAQLSASAVDKSLPQFIQELPRTEVLLPGRMGVSSLRHFDTVKESLLLLTKAGKAANDRAS